MTKFALILAAVTLMSAGAILSLAGECCASAGATAALTEGKTIKWVAFGEPMKIAEEKSISAEAIMKDVKAYEGKTVRMKGVVSSVCSKKGCWLKMTSEGASMPVFVHFTCPVEGRLIPMEATGMPVFVEGKVIVKTIDEESARHIAEEEGKSKEEIEAIKGYQTQIEIEGPSALIGMVE